MDGLTKNQKKYLKRRSPKYLAEAAQRAREWRAANKERHRASEKERYKKKKLDDPEGLRAAGRVIAARWRENNPERAREVNARSNLKRREAAKSARYMKKYGLTADQVSAMLDKQGGVCAICKTDTSRGWCVDHCHTSNAVRGILCHDCNTGLGFFRDSRANLNNAIEYLDMFADQTMQNPIT
jgi:hypothetical protein